MWPGASEGRLVFCCETNHTLTVSAAGLFLVIYPKELKTPIHTKSCTWMFTAALFVTAQTWKPPFSEEG